MTLGLSVAVSALVVPSAPATALAGATLRHHSPVRAVAGDPLDIRVEVLPGCAGGCPPLTVSVNYSVAGGGTRTVSTTTSGARREQVVLTLPGNAVRFPGLSYYLTATPLDGADLSTRAPAVGSYHLDVDNVLRVGFRRADGSPAADVSVVARPQRSGPVWTGTTDSSGFAEITVPEGEQWVAAGAADPGYSQYFITAFDAVPDGSNDNDVTVEGNGTEVVTVVNLGSPLLAAVDNEVQDRIFTLRPQRRTFAPAAGASVGCQTFPNGQAWACVEMVERIFNVGIPLVNNVGGGSEMTSTYNYGSSTFTTTGVLVNGGAGWFEADGETTSEQQVNWDVSTGVVGPGANQTAIAYYNFVRERESWCMLGSCSTTERVRPEGWNIGFSAPTSAGLHDFAQQMSPAAGSDCVVPAAVETTSHSSKGEKLRFSISIGGSAYGLNARTRYSNDTNTTVRAVHKWRVVGNARSHHHLFVKYGLADPNDPNGDSNRCPHTHPGQTWTDSSNIDKAVYGPAARHVVNEIHHGLFRSVDIDGPDRIHTWAAHDHGGKRAGVATCAVSSPCTLNSPDRVSQCSAWVDLPHVHCEAYSDSQHSTGFYFTNAEPGGTAQCLPPHTESVAWTYTDGHGIECHDMYETFGAGTTSE